jgi:hypothetical protein
MSFIAVAAVVAVGAGVGASYLKAGDKPQVPDFPKLDLETLQKLGIQGNQDVLAQAQQLASDVNKGNLAEVAKSREAAVPGATALARKNITDQLSGVADIADTQAAISNASAANFSLGVGGKSQFSKFGIVGHLGRSVAQQKQQGLGNFFSFANLMDAPRFDPASMFFTPAQRLNAAQWQAQGQFGVDTARAAIAAQPSKISQALGGGLGVVSNLASMGFGSAIGGGGMSGGSGGGSKPFGMVDYTNAGRVSGEMNATETPWYLKG